MYAYSQFTKPKMLLMAISYESECFQFLCFGSGPDPEILKLQTQMKSIHMIMQTLIVLGNEEILNAIRQLNSKEAQRSAMDSMNILDVLVTKHMVDKLEYDVGGYDVLPCGQAMTLCNNIN